MVPPPSDQVANFAWDGGEETALGPAGSRGWAGTSREDVDGAQNPGAEIPAKTSYGTKPKT